MLGLYSLVFELVMVVMILAGQATARKKAIDILLLAPVIAYIAITTKVVKPIAQFVLANIQSLI